MFTLVASILGDPITIIGTVVLQCLQREVLKTKTTEKDEDELTLGKRKKVTDMCSQKVSLNILL